MAFGQRGIFVVKFSGQLLTGEKAVKSLVAFKTCPAFGCLNFAHDARCTAGAVFFQRRFVFQRTIRTFGRRSNIAFVTLWTHTAFETIDYVSKFTHATTAANIGCDKCAIFAPWAIVTTRGFGKRLRTSFGAILARNRLVGSTDVTAWASICKCTRSRTSKSSRTKFARRIFRFFIHPSTRARQTVHHRYFGCNVTTGTDETRSGLRSTGTLTCGAVATGRKKRCTTRKCVSNKQCSTFQNEGKVYQCVHCTKKPYQTIGANDDVLLPAAQF